MTDKKKSPESQRRQAKGITGDIRDCVVSVPVRLKRRRSETLLRFQGQYDTPQSLHKRIAAEAEESRGCRGPAPYGDASHAPAGDQGPFQPGPHVGLEFSARHPANRFPAKYTVDGGTGEIYFGAGGGGGPEGGALPCRSLETTQSRVPQNLTGPHKKTALALSWNVSGLCEKYGVERVGFLTLTFADHVVDAREASRRFNSLATNVLKARYLDYIRVLERQRSGRIHYHLLVVLPDDIKTGFDFGGVAQGNYKSANNHLRREWAFWRKTAPLYRFGRTELMPVKGTADALGQYVGKYIGKHIGHREEADKGVRLVSYSRGARMATSRFTSIDSFSFKEGWRPRLKTFVDQMNHAFSITHPHRPPMRCMADLKFYFGPRWAYHWRDHIMNLPPSDLSVPF